ncbi:hypothetical protein BDW74DRAFT_141500, partial [Aspergillus multicolor]|uniref:uncharacterized protein n=1 Tax=Aspergillus multicolor TaxID=41759 RepID=UPI003CCDD7A8
MRVRLTVFGTSWLSSSVCFLFLGRSGLKGGLSSSGSAPVLGTRGGSTRPLKRAWALWVSGDRSRVSPDGSEALRRLIVNSRSDYLKAQEENRILKERSDAR